MAVGLLVLLFCLATALTQVVNPSPHDGWFWSQYRIFLRVPGGDNYTPIGAPAYLYAAARVPAKIFGWDLQTHFYSTSVLHHLLLFLSGVCLHLSHRCLGLTRSGLVSSALLVVLLESTLMLQAAWSENVTVFLMAAILLIGLYLLVNPALGSRQFLCLTILLSLVLGVFVTTRAVPIVILPALVLLFWGVVPRIRVVRFSLVSTARDLDGYPDPFTATITKLHVPSGTETALEPGRHPAWSPDGNLIAFNDDSVGNPNGGGVYTMAPDGSDVSMVVDIGKRAGLVAG